MRISDGYEAIEHGLLMVGSTKNKNLRICENEIETRDKWLCGMSVAEECIVYFEESKGN